MNHPASQIAWQHLVWVNRTMGEGVPMVEHMPLATKLAVKGPPRLMLLMVDGGLNPETKQHTTFILAEGECHAAEVADWPGMDVAPMRQRAEFDLVVKLGFDPLSAKGVRLR